MGGHSNIELPLTHSKGVPEPPEVFLELPAGVLEIPAAIFEHVFLPKRKFLKIHVFSVNSSLYASLVDAPTLSIIVPVVNLSCHYLNYLTSTPSSTEENPTTPTLGFEPKNFVSEDLLANH